MASKNATRALRASMRQLRAPVQQRSFGVAAVNASRPTVAAAQKTSFVQQQVRGKKTVDFAGDKEVVFERADWPREKLLVSIDIYLMNESMGAEC